MWQKPAQPSASIYRVQQRPASAPARRSLSLSIRVPFVPASSLPHGLRRASFLLFRPVALRLLFLLLSALITVGVARQQPVHRGQANFLPAVILFRPSLPLSPSAPRAGLTRPLRARTIFPSRFSSLHAVIYHRAVGFCPFSSSPTPGAARRILRLLTAVRHVLLPLPTTSYCYYYPRLSFLNPFLPTCLSAMMQCALSISATLIDDNNFLATSGFLARPRHLSRLRRICE